MKAEDLKMVVKEKYAEIAMQDKAQNQSSCCGSGCGCGDTSYTIFSDDYSTLQGYNPDADLGLGCGMPTEFAGIKPGDSVLDLGSGAGNDCFVARSLVGEKGKVTGLDFTDAMLEKARVNAAKLKYTNIEFVKGDIEEMPLPSDTFDVVISNCVLNLVPDKQKAFTQIFRVLKKGGHFCISDVVLSGQLPEALRNEAVMYAGCVAGAQQKEEYLETIRQAGFRDIQIRKEKQITLPDEILVNYLDESEIKEYKASNLGIFSITVTASKS
jgi:ubiquinone/menaquinone biosynthesis C-methylase UbiE